MISAAATDKIPEAWKNQLKIGGKIVTPVSSSIHVLEKVKPNKFITKKHFGFSFVPLIKESPEV
ncbi:MAG: hypothetical protein ABEI53_00395 [Candidatus Magasanikbacteria bacterium]